MISQVTPAVVSTNSVVSVYGENFTVSTVAFVDGAAVPTTWIDTSHLRFEDFHAAPGSVLVRVEDGALTSNDATMMVQASGSIHPAVAGGPIAPQGMTFGSLVTAQDIVVFDTSAGIAVISEPTSGAFGNRFIRVGSPAVKPNAGAFDAAGRLVVADRDGNLIRRRDTAGNWSIVASALPAPITGITTDSTNAIYFVTGGPSVGQVTAAGAVNSSFATVPAGFGVVALANQLYISDPAGNAIHRVNTMTGAVTTDWSTGHTGVRGITTNGTDIYAAVDDTVGTTSIKRISIAGAVTNMLPQRGLRGGASSSVLIPPSGPPSCQLSTDSAVICNYYFPRWTALTASMPLSRSDRAVFLGETLYVANGAACDGGGNSDSVGTLVEAPGGTYLRAVWADTCAGKSLSLTPDGRLAWIDHVIAIVRIFDPASVGGGGTMNFWNDFDSWDTDGIAVTSLDNFFVSKVDRIRYGSSTGSVITNDLVGSLPSANTGIAFVADALYIALPDRILRVPVDPISGSTGSMEVALSTTAGYLDIHAPSALGGTVLFLSSGMTYQLQATGAVTPFLPIPANATSVSISPYGGIVFTTPDGPPMVRLP